MEIYRIDISSWTASFRYPNLISGVQPTLEVPPISTVLGLINAAAGRYLEHKKLRIGYCFQYGAKGTDLESMYQISSDSKGRPSNIAKMNIIRREFLFEAILSLYLQDKTIVEFLSKPHYSLLLGRSNDLATVDKITIIDLESVKNPNKIKGQIIPLEQGLLPGKVQALPIYFSDTIPRQNLFTQPYSVIPYYARDTPTELLAYRDTTQLKDGVDIFFHEVETTNCE